MPAPSRYLAMYLADSTTIRSLPSFPTVSAAVRVRPFESLHRAHRSPLRVKISAPAGSGFVTVFLKTAPMNYLPLPVGWANRSLIVADSLLHRSERSQISQVEQTAPN